MDTKDVVKKGWPKGKKRDKPSHTKQTSANAREQVIKKIYKHKDALLQAQIELGKGLWYEDTEKGCIVYQKKPNAAVGEYLLNQLIGKPKENVEIIGEVELKVDM
jgi:hypothetical protein